MIDILIADDHQMFLDGIKVLLQTETDIQIVGEATDGRQVLELLRTRPVDIAVLDIDMPGLNGIETAEQILKDFPQTRILILTMHNKKEFIVDLINLGAAGYILKSRSSDELVEAIRKIAAGKPHFSNEVLQTATSLQRIRRKDTPVQLTSREEDVLRLIGDCQTSREIAEALHIAESTVESHIRNLLGKLDLRNRMQLVRYAVEHGYTEGG